MNNTLKNLLLYVALPLVVLVSLFTLYRGDFAAKETKYYQVVEKFNTNKIQEFTLTLSNGSMTYVERGKTEKDAVTYKVPNVNVFLDDIDEARKASDKTTDASKKMKYELKPGSSSSWISNLIPTLLMIVVMVVFWLFIMRKMGGAGDKTMNFGKAKFKVNKDDKRKTTFTDVAGADEEKEELKEIVDFLKNPAQFNELGARIPKGVLLVGPPGTGKTLLARAVAGEADVPFFSISGSDFVEMFVGVGASRVRDLFEQAKKNAPAIIFIDEIDAVGRQRGAGLGGGHDEREQTLNQLLVEMDGFGANEGVIIIAATNRPDILDKALLRPGRFDRQVTVNYPDVKGREEILKVHARNKPLGPDVDLNRIAKTTAGFTGADLENLLNEAALFAARLKRKAITESDIEEATIKVQMGAEKRSHVVTERDRKITAYHEAGHAILAYLMPSMKNEVHQISIIPRGQAGGYTMYRPEDDDKFDTKNGMLDYICSALGGRIAESLTQDDITSGASGDIQQVTNIARSMVTKYGLSNKLGMVAYAEPHAEVFLGRDYNQSQNVSEKYSALIDDEVLEIVNSQYSRGEQLLKQNMDKLVEISEMLLKVEKISGDDFMALMKGEKTTSDGLVQE